MTILFNDKYECKVDTKAFCQMEKDLGGKNPINCLYENDLMPPLSVLLIILYRAGKRLNKWDSIDTVYDIFDTYCAEGGSISELASFIVDLFNASGMLGKGDSEETSESKN